MKDLKEFKERLIKLEAKVESKYHYDLRGLNYAKAPYRLAFDVKDLFKYDNTLYDKFGVDWETDLSKNLQNVLIPITKEISIILGVYKNDYDAIVNLSISLKYKNETYLVGTGYYTEGSGQYLREHDMEYLIKLEKEIMILLDKCRYIRADEDRKDEEDKRKAFEEFDKAIAERG